MSKSKNVIFVAFAMYRPFEFRYTLVKVKTLILIYFDFNNKFGGIYVRKRA